MLHQGYSSLHTKRFQDYIDIIFKKPELVMFIEIKWDTISLSKQSFSEPNLFFAITNQKEFFQPVNWVF